MKSLRLWFVTHCGLEDRSHQIYTIVNDKENGVRWYIFSNICCM